MKFLSTNEYAKMTKKLETFSFEAIKEHLITQIDKAIDDPTNKSIYTIGNKGQKLIVIKYAQIPFIIIETTKGNETDDLTELLNEIKKGNADTIIKNIMQEKPFLAYKSRMQAIHAKNKKK